MILTCTSCSTRYYTDDAAIGASGRTVRCAACGHSWFAEPQLTLNDRAVETTARVKQEPLTRERVERLRRAAEQPGPAPSAAAKFRAQQAERMRRERGRAAIAAWGATGVAFAASAAGMVVFRQDVAELWPRSASAFAALGLDVNVYGLEFYDLAVERAFDGPTPVLLVSGEVRNIGRDDKMIPPVRISLRDEHSNEIFQIVHAMDGEPIVAGAATSFQIRLENPPVDAVDLEATFASFAEANAATAAPTAPVSHDTPLELTHPVDEEGHAPVGEPRRVQ
ncbi:MAG: MJ0042-type zinc finger domain-containing protein [Terricaulis sp.]